jgi:hypothetical protein
MTLERAEKEVISERAIKTLQDFVQLQTELPELRQVAGKVLKRRVR